MIRVSVLSLVASAAIGMARAETCGQAESNGIPYVVCRFDPKTDDIRLFHAGTDGEPWRHFGRLSDTLAERSEKLVFAMNAGMYLPNRAPVGLYVEGGVTRAAINNRDCSGNFCLKPNGVFWISEKDGVVAAHVSATEAFTAGATDVCDASQSGPMLVIDGQIHPKFRKDSQSRYRRNGVGVTADGKVIFAISDAPITFFEFATFFRDDLKTPNALYFDGAISRLYAPELDRNDAGAAMGPIVAVVEKINEGTTP